MAHSSPAAAPKSPKAPEIAVGVIAVVAVIAIAVRIVIADANISREMAGAQSQEAVTKRIAPVARLELEGGGQEASGAAKVAAAPSGKPDGKKIYDTACMACHATGAANAPKFADKAAWAPRVKTGNDALYASALKGKGAMPPKGGNAALSDSDVKAAVDYLVAAAK